MHLASCLLLTGVSDQIRAFNNLFLFFFCNVIKITNLAKLFSFLFSKIRDFIERRESDFFTRFQASLFFTKKVGCAGLGEFP